MKACRPIDASAGGDFSTDGGNRALVAAILTAGAGADATASAVDTDGKAVFNLAAKAGTTAPFQPCVPAIYRGKLTVTKAGAGLALIIYEA